MTEPEKLALRLGMVLRNIAELYAEKAQVEKQLRDFAEAVMEECRETGRTVEEIGVEKWQSS